MGNLLARTIIATFFLATACAHAQQSPKELNSRRLAAPADSLASILERCWRAEEIGSSRNVDFSQDAGLFRGKVSLRWCRTTLEARGPVERRANRDYLARISCQYTADGTGNPITRDGWKCYAWHYTFKRYERGAWRQHSGDYFMGIGLKGRPTAATVLHSLILDSSANGQSFPGWCSDFGYDADSIRAFEIYRKCLDIAESLAKLFTPEQRADLAKMLEDY